MKKTCLSAALICLIALLTLPLCASGGSELVLSTDGLREGDTVNFGRYHDDRPPYNDAYYPIPWTVLPSDQLSESTPEATGAIPLLSRHLLGKPRSLGTCSTFCPMITAIYPPPSKRC